MRILEAAESILQNGYFVGKKYMEEGKIMGKSALSQGLRENKVVLRGKFLQSQQFRKLSALLFGTHNLLIMFINCFLL